MPVIIITIMLLFDSPGPAFRVGREAAALHILSFGCQFELSMFLLQDVQVSFGNLKCNPDVENTVQMEGLFKGYMKLGGAKPEMSGVRPEQVLVSKGWASPGQREVVEALDQRLGQKNWDRGKRRTHRYVYTCTRVHMYRYTHIHIYTHMHIHLHTCTHIRIHAHTYVHNDTHTQWHETLAKRNWDLSEGTRWQLRPKDAGSHVYIYIYIEREREI